MFKKGDLSLNVVIMAVIALVVLVVLVVLVMNAAKNTNDGTGCMSVGGVCKGDVSECPDNTLPNPALACGDGEICCAGFGAS